MVHLDSIRRMDRTYREHKKEILSSGHRFAVISGWGEIDYFDSRSELYEAHPCFSPDAEPIFGTLPKLIDIGKKTKSRDYRIERLNEREVDLKCEEEKLSARRASLDCERQALQDEREELGI